jgi:hypothetical protein
MAGTTLVLWWCIGPTFSSAQEAPVQKLRLYGFIKTDFVFDDSRTNDVDATTFVLPEQSTPNDRQFGATVKNSRLGLDLEGPKLWGGNIKGKLEIDFFDKTTDNAFKPRVRHLYADLVSAGWSLLIGQSWDVVGPLGPATLNTNGWLWNAGNIGFRRTQARLTYKSGISERWGIALQMSINRNIGVSNSSLNTGDDSGWPLLEARMSMTKKTMSGRVLELGLGGLYGEEEIDRQGEAPGGRWRARQSGVVGDFLVPISHPLTLQGEFYVGTNLDALLAGIGQGVNLLKETGIRTSGGWAQISYKILGSLTLNSGFGVDRVDNGDINSGDKASNQVFFFNVFFSPIEPLGFGAEFSDWRTRYLALEVADNNKLQVSVTWSF